MPVTDSSIDDLWTGRPFAEAPPPAPPPPPPTSARSASVETDEDTAAEHVENAEDVVVDPQESSAPDEVSLDTILDELRLLREDRTRSFRAALALACLAFAVIAGYMDRLLKELRRRPPLAAP